MTRPMTRSAALATVLAALLLGGCMSQPDPKDAATSLRQDRAKIVATLRDVAADLTRDGGSATEATGAYGSCGSAPTYAIDYRAGAKLPGDGSPMATRIKAAVKTLEASGWKVTDATYTDDPYPNARLEKDGIQPSREADRITHGQGAGQRARRPGAARPPGLKLVALA